MLNLIKDSAHARIIGVTGPTRQARSLGCGDNFRATGNCAQLPGMGIDINLLRDNLSALMEARGTNPKRLARDAGLGETAIRDIMKGRSDNPKVDTIHKIADALQVPLYRLTTNIESAQPVRYVPLVGAISAGDWMLAIQEPLGHVPTMDGGPRAFAVRVQGDSMDMIVVDGDYVVVDPDDCGLVDGRLYAVMNGSGETTFKRYRSNPARLEPCSTNSKHKTIVLGQHHCSVIGRVVWRGGQL